LKNENIKQNNNKTHTGFTGKLASPKNPRKWGKLFDFRSVFIDPPQVVEKIPPVRITFPDGTHIFSDQDDIILSKALGHDVRLMTAKSVKPSYEEYWPDIDGLAQREKITDETMPPPRYRCNPSLDDFYNQPSARTLPRRAL